MIFYVPKYSTVDGNVVETSREYFDHSTVCGIDRAANPNLGCIITLANGRRIDCSSDANDVAGAIQSGIREPMTIPNPVSLEI